MVADNDLAETLFVISSDSERSGTLAAELINYLDDHGIRYRFNKGTRNLTINGVPERIAFLSLDRHELRHKLVNHRDDSLIADDIGYDELDHEAVGLLDKHDTELIEYVKSELGKNNE